MKCRYTHCKLGGEVDKEDAVKDGNMYYHEQCHNKQLIKAKLRDILMSRHMVQRDINIALKRAIDDEGYDINYIEYVAIEKANKITDPYKLLYQLKIDDNYKEYQKIYSAKQQLKINQAVKIQEINNDGCNFTINKTKHKRLNIY